MNKARRIAQLEREIQSQVEWIAKCGGTLEGYIKSYGSMNDAEHSGNGGEPIYQADIEHLRVLISYLDNNLQDVLDEPRAKV